MIAILHDLMYQDPRNSSSIVYSGHAGCLSSTLVRRFLDSLGGLLLRLFLRTFAHLTPLHFRTTLARRRFLEGSVATVAVELETFADACYDDTAATHCSTKLHEFLSNPI